MNAAVRPAGVTACEGRQAWWLPGRGAAELRPLAPHDRAAEQAFFNGLSLDSRHQRFHVGLRELSPALLALLTDVDPRLHRAWVVEAGTPSQEIVADARFVCEARHPTHAEFAVAVADAWQGRGLGRRLIAHLIDAARHHGVHQLHGDMLAENRRMQALMREFGARLQRHPDGPQLVRAVLPLAG